MANQANRDPDSIGSVKLPINPGGVRKTVSGGEQLRVLLCLTGIVITAPLLTILSENPELFSFHNVDSYVLVSLFAVTVAFLPAVLLYIVSAISGLLNKNISTFVHYVTVGVLAGLWLVQWAKWSLSIEQPWIITSVALVGGAAFVYTYIRWNILSSLLKFAAFAPLVALGFFLYSPGMKSVTEKQLVDISRVETNTKHPSVVFILLDEFPTMGLLDEEGALDDVRFPNLAELLQQGVWYRHFTVLADVTGRSVPSILTGDMPRVAVPRMFGFPKNLFTLLAPTHHLTVFEVVTKLCDLPACSQAPPGSPIKKPSAEMGALLQKTASIWRQRVSIKHKAVSRFDDFEEKLAKAGTKNENCDQVLEDRTWSALVGPQCQVERAQYKLQRVSQFTDTIIDSQIPALYFIHIEMPHIPWRFFENGQPYNVPFLRDPFDARNVTGGEWLTRVSEYRFLMQAQYTDRVLGDVFARLKTLGIWEDLLVVVTADHGRSFKPNTNSRASTPQTFDSIAYAPLFIKRPNQQRGYIDDSNLMAHDIVPTIADILQIDSPWPMAGRPAGHPEITLRGDQKFFYPSKDKDPGKGKKRSWKIMGSRERFSDKEHFPKYSSRWIGSSKNVDNQINLLNQSLGLDRFYGRSPGNFETRKGGAARVEDLAILRNPEPDEAALGIVVGNLDFQPTGDVRILISINDRFVTGSPLVNFRKIPNTFIAVLPKDVLTAHNEVGVYLVDKGELIELDIH